MVVLAKLREHWVEWLTWMLQFDILLYAAVVLFNAACKLVRKEFVEMSTRPFFLNDATLWLPYSKEQTVSTDQLELITMLQLGILFVVEALLASLLLSVSTSCFKKGFRQGLCSAARLVIAAYLAVTILTSVNALIKNVGILRPGYAQICLGSEAVLPLDPYSSEVFTSDDQCTVEGNKFKNHIHDGRRSFTSRHAGESFCIAAFVTLYCLYRGATLSYWSTVALFGPSGRQESQLASLLKSLSLRFVAQLLFFYCMPCVMIAFYIACSRLWDHQHHPADVVGGAVLGVMAAVGMFLAVAPSIHKDYFARFCFATNVAIDSHKELVGPGLPGLPGEPEEASPEDDSELGVEMEQLG